MPHLSTVAQFFIAINGLPETYTWQDLKDLLRCRTSHQIWADTARGGGWSHWVRVSQSDEARNLFDFLSQAPIQGRFLHVGVWDTTSSPPSFMYCNRNHNHGIPQENSAISSMLREPDAWNPVPSPERQYPVLPPGTNVQTVSYAVQQSVPRYCQAPFYPNMAPPVNESFSGFANQVAPIAPVPVAMAPAYPGSNIYRTSRSALPINLANGVVSTQSRGVWIGNLPFKTTKEQIENAFSAVGLVIKVTLLKDSAGKSKGTATVLFDSGEAAERAVHEFRDQEWGGRQLQVRLDTEQTPIGRPMVTYPGRRSGRSRDEPIIVNGSNGSKRRDR